MRPGIVDQQLDQLGPPIDDEPALPVPGLARRGVAFERRQVGHPLARLAGAPVQEGHDGVEVAFPCRRRSALAARLDEARPLLGRDLVEQADTELACDFLHGGDLAPARLTPRIAL